MHKQEHRLEYHRPTGDRVETTTCYMCACRCGIRVHVEGERIRFIDGNPEHPVNRGVICAKGSAGIQQHESPARLSAPMKRVGPRGSGEFVTISWDEALATAAEWLGAIRRRNPDELAFFTGRDQSQALTGWWAQQFGTINYAAHGGFCSVNMAAAGMYTLGSAFWEFGEPDFEHARYVMFWGVAEDHDSNPLKLGLGKLKARGAKLVAVNPVRTGYAALADEWLAIRPGTDGLFALALVHELLRLDRIDLEYLVRYTNAHWLVVDAPGSAGHGLFARDAEGRALCVDRTRGVVPADTAEASPRVVGAVTLADGTRARPVFELLAERYLDPSYAADAVAERCGIDAETIRRVARELAHAAFDEAFELPQPWTDAHGRMHPTMRGRPVAMHAMRGISAHSNGFQTCRAIHLLQLLLGAVETPGSFRFQPPYPKQVPPANRPGRARRADGSLDAGPLGYPQSPSDLLVAADGTPRRIDHAYSWAYPLAVHGMLHTVIRNAWARDPYPIDTLFLFMANMGWNSAMNTAETQRWLTDVDEATGEYRIPRIVYCDAYASETVAYADLVFPDPTYLERHDAISMLDRPISDADAAIDGIRRPVVPPRHDCRGFQSALLDLGARLGLPGMTNDDGTPRYRDYADYIVRHERSPGIGLLAGHRGEDGTRYGIGAPNPAQLERYAEQGCFHRHEIPPSARYYKMANRDYLAWAADCGFLPRPAGVGASAPIGAAQSRSAMEGGVGAPISAGMAGSSAVVGGAFGPDGAAARSKPDAVGAEGPSHKALAHDIAQPHPAAIVLQIYSEPLQRFRLAAEGHGEHQPPDALRARVAAHFDPLPIWYAPFEHAEVDEAAFPLRAITQRPMFMYHAWHSQNRWLRQIATRNVLYVHPDTAAAHGLEDGDVAHVDSHHGRITVEVQRHTGVEPGTVWTWNAIGKRRGAWALAPDAPEATRGFIVNDLVSDVLPRTPRANADPITGQAAWYDLRVRLTRAEPQHVPPPTDSPGETA